MKRKVSLFIFNYIYLILLIVPFVTIYDANSGCNGWNFGMFYHAPIISIIFVLINLVALTFNLLVLTNTIFKDSLTNKYEKGNRLSYVLCIVFFIVIILLFDILIIYSLRANRLPGCL